MPNCTLSSVKLLDSCFSSVFTKSGLRPTTTDFGDGTVIHCWVPKRRKKSNPDIVLLHGFGVTATWQWSLPVCRLARHFNLYVPDLLFFGEYSRTTRPERSASFQAECVMRALEANGVAKLRAAVGLSYGGYVAYSMGERYGGEGKVERVVICCCGVCVEEKDLKDGMFVVKDLERAADLLTPQTPEKLMELLACAIYRPPTYLPSCLLNDFIQVMCREYVEEKGDLLRAILKDRKVSEIPRISQPTLIMWGDKDKIFPVELAYRLERHLGDNAQLVIIKNAGHCFHAERVKEFCKHLKAFVMSPHPVPASHHLPTPLDAKVASNGSTEGSTT